MGRWGDGEMGVLNSKFKTPIHPHTLLYVTDFGEALSQGDAFLH